MADTGWVTFGNAAFYDFGSAGNEWVNITNAQVQDGTYAVGTANTGIDDIYFYDFGFADLIPEQSTFDGLEIRIRAKISQADTSSIEVWLLWDGEGGDDSDDTDFSFATGNLSTSDTDYTMGVTNQFTGWGVRRGGATPFPYVNMTDIRDPGFGFYASIEPPSSGRTVSLDFVAVKVYYTEGQVRTSERYPTSTGTVDNGAVNWTNAGNITTSNNSRATCTVSGTTNSDGLLALAYDFSDIPDDAPILSFLVETEKFRNGGSTGQIRDNTLQIRNAGTNVGDNKATATNWPTSETFVSEGSETSTHDDWNTSLTGADLKNAASGVYLSVQGAASGANRVANVDTISVIVTWQVPAAPPSGTMPLIIWWN